VHGPKQYHHAWNGGERRHLYGPDGASGSAPVFLGELEDLSEEKKERMRREAMREYREIERNLTPEERAKIEEVLLRQKEHDRVARREKREYERRVEKSGLDGDSDGPGLTARALEQIAAEVAEQFATEKKELKKQLQQEKKEWKKMLAANHPKQKKPPKG